MIQLDRTPVGGLHDYAQSPFRLLGFLQGRQFSSPQGFKHVAQVLYNKSKSRRYVSIVFRKRVYFQNSIAQLSSEVCGARSMLVFNEIDTDRFVETFDQIQSMGLKNNQGKGDSWHHISLPNDLHQNPLAAAAIKLIVKNVLPRAEVELAIGNGDHHLTSHDLAFVMRVGVVFAGAVMQVAAAGRVGAGVEGDEFFQPAIIVLVQAAFVVVNEDTGRDMHCVYKYQALLNSTFRDAVFDVAMNVDDHPTFGYVHPEFFGVRLHRLSLLRCRHLSGFERL